MLYTFDIWEREKQVFLVRSVNLDGRDTHEHDFIELVYVSSGTGIHCINSRRYSVSGGDIFIVFPGEYHSLCPIGAGEDFSWINCSFLPGFIDFDFSIFPRNDRLIASGSFDLNLIFNVMLDEYFARRADFDSVLKSYLNIILIRLKRYILDERGGYPALRRHNYCKYAAGYISENFRVNIKPGDIARRLGISASYLSRVFRAGTGVSPEEYIAGERIREACRLLGETGLTAAEVGVRSGFPDRKNFYTQFTRRMGMAPGTFRKRCRTM